MVRRSKGDEETALLESTPLYINLPSPSSTLRPTSYASLSQAFSSQGSLVHARSEADEERSVGSLELQMPEHLILKGRKESLFKRTCQASFTKFLVAVLIMVLGACTMFLSKSWSSGGSGTQSQGTGSNGEALNVALPFSWLDPVTDLSLENVVRSKDTIPSPIIHREGGQALPTNKWYENFMQSRGEPTTLQRAYSIPYIVDVMGPIPGLRLHPVHVDATQTVVQLTVVDPHGLSIGSFWNAVHPAKNSKLTKQYSVLGTTPLGINLQWNVVKMTTSIVRGMPYATMTYPTSQSNNQIIPTIASEVTLLNNPLADGKTQVKCSNGDAKVRSYHVKRELQMTFEESDFTWVAFFSRPVELHCVSNREGFENAKTVIQFRQANGADSLEEELIARVALLTNCTTGKNPIYCRHFQASESQSQMTEFAIVLRNHSGIYPGPATDIGYNIDSKNNIANVAFDWDARQMYDQDDEQELIVFALPHQLEDLSDMSDFCTPVLLGHSCLVVGSAWTLKEVLPPIGFNAERPPRPDALTLLSDALQDDLTFQIPEYYMRGAGDTYFSGKILAKVARILLIANEVRDICTRPSARIPSEDRGAYLEACVNSTIPTVEEIEKLLGMLRRGVQVWIDGNAETPFVYDRYWGGVISCGCLFNEKTQSCDNSFPDCPTTSDPGLDFGNGFYNDHHFHYGYHVYAAAAVAKYDPDWGRKYFEQVLLLIRDFANPSLHDKYFPLFRHKDWYEGHSWASGVSTPAYLNGKNQESSSEAIAAYEAMALFGEVMINAWEHCHNCEKQAQVRVSTEIRDVGMLLTATEIKAADRYWHVRQADEALRIYPKEYRQNAIGILWQTMAQFQTWFGNSPYLPYGIQLLPLTPISEYRDDTLWLKEMYEPFANACDQDRSCEESGWSILQLAVLSAVGHTNLAAERARALPPDVFTSAGGNGHSLSNTLWYIATRQDTDPIQLPSSDSHVTPHTHDESTADKNDLVDCGLPESCTEEVLNMSAGEYTCGERINWLIHSFGQPQREACAQIAGIEFPNQCGKCNPNRLEPATQKDAPCPPCSEEECDSDLNRCPLYDRTYVCSDGKNVGGCRAFPWNLHNGQCNKCCELTHCPKRNVGLKKKVPIDASMCPPCESAICSNHRLNLCPLDDSPYLCIKGPAYGGCSPHPWDREEGECKQCCTLTPECGAAASPKDFLH